MLASTCLYSLYAWLILADTVYTEDVQEIDEAAVAVVRTGDDRSGAHSRHVGADAVAASVAGQ